MNRSAPLAAVPHPTPMTAAEYLLTIDELSERLRASRSKIERDVEMGLPHVDIGSHDPRRRRKRALRFDLAAVLEWYQGRHR